MVVRLMFLIFLISVNGISAQQIYLSPGGNDLNSGTINNPVASLNGALVRAREYRQTNPGTKIVEVIALAGKYNMLQPLVVTGADVVSDTASSLIIRSEQGAKAVFSGGVEIRGFQKVNDSLWKTFVPQVAFYNSTFQQLYVNGRRAVRARTPNESFFFINDASETILDKGNGRIPVFAAQKIKIDSLQSDVFSSFRKKDFEDALIVFYHKWDNTRKHIASYNPATFELITTGTGMQPWNSFDKQTRYYIENSKSFLDAPGEWYLENSGTLWYMPRKGESIDNTTVIAPIIKDFIEIKGEPGKVVKNIHFESLIFEAAGYEMPSGGDEAAQAASPVDAVITLDYADGISFKNCEVAHTGTYAFWFRRACSNCIVNSCYMHDLGAGGIKIGETSISNEVNSIPHNIIIDNNIIRDAGHVFPCAVGVLLFNASDNQLTHNEISDLRYTGISAGWVWGYDQSPSKRNKIEFNHIHHLGWGELSDMGGVYTLGASEGTTVSNNVIHHIYSFDYGGWGLYTDEGSSGIVEENNLVYACKNSGFHQHYGKDNIIRNNIFAMNMKAQLQATRVEEHRSITFTNNIVIFDKGTLLSSNWHKFNLLTDKNCYWNIHSKEVMFAGKSFEDWKKSGKDVHSVIADPMFVDPAGFDFQFKKLSVAKRIGFIPFDDSKAGVYGSEEWKKLAATDRGTTEAFDRKVADLEAKDL